MVVRNQCFCCAICAPFNHWNKHTSLTGTLSSIVLVFEDCNVLSYSFCQEESMCMSVESTDLDSEEEPSSLLTSAAPSPAPSQRQENNPFQTPSAVTATWCVSFYHAVMVIRTVACQKNSGKRLSCLCGDTLHSTSETYVISYQTMWLSPLSRYANLFLHPVKEDDAPGYREVIHRPMDLSSIKRNIENGVSYLYGNDGLFELCIYVCCTVMQS